MNDAIIHEEKEALTSVPISSSSSVRILLMILTDLFKIFTNHCILKSSKVSKKHEFQCPDVSEILLISYPR